MKSDNLEHIRHSAAHLLAAAVLRLYPDTKLTIGPAIDTGFYYDLDFATPITDTDLPKIEKMMQKTLVDWKEFTHREVTPEEAREFYKNNPYKLELIDEIVKKGEKLTFYKAGHFEDLCRGGHSENPSQDIGAFKLLSLAGAYWRGSEKNKMLTRIYGTAFATQEELDSYLTMLEEAKKRDHKKLGLAQNLFFFAETAPGMPYWLPKGLILYNELLNFSRTVHKQYGYQEVSTPIINKKELYETSGHWFHYRDDMFISPMSFIRGDSKEVLDGTETFGIKPMNCPNAMTIFNMGTRSYRELPLRLSETTALHRFELSGTLNGLFRAREFHQDDAHVFVTTAQIEDEFKSIMEMIEIFYSTFNLSYRLRFGTRPNNFMGEKEDWDVAEKSLRDVLVSSKKEYMEVEKEGAFYGPKVDILVKDSLGREWQTGTIQLDFQQPKNFDLHYADDTGAQVRPAAIHRAIYGSFERFLAILIEHYAGLLPVWLSPVQVAVLPISDKVIEYAKTVEKEFLKHNIRAELDSSSASLGGKIRSHTLQKVPFLCIIGEKEQERSTTESKKYIAVRSNNGTDMGTVELDSFLLDIKKTIEKRI